MQNLISDHGEQIDEPLRTERENRRNHHEQEEETLLYEHEAQSIAEIIDCLEPCVLPTADRLAAWNFHRNHHQGRDKKGTSVQIEHSLSSNSGDKDAAQRRSHP